MEKIYLKGFPRGWHSEKVDLESYFTEYSAEYRKITRVGKMSIPKILNSILPSNVSLNENQMEELCILTDEKQLVLTEQLKGKRPTKTMNKNYSNIHELTDISLPTDGTDCEKTGNTANGVDDSTMSRETPLHISVLKFGGLVKSSKYKQSILTCRRELLLDTRRENSRINLQKGKDFLVSFRIQEPFIYETSRKPENFQQEILVLGDQTLDYLREKIICQTDFQYTQGDVSDSPDGPWKLAKIVYKSAMFYIDNTFYIDSDGPEDYSQVIRDWAQPRGINVGPTMAMTAMPVGKLKLRFGYPYLYMHQGFCEHLIIVNDARLLTGEDSLHSSDYPLLSCIPRHLTQNCFACNSSPASWIVTENDRMLYDCSEMCNTCFKMFNYTGGQKDGKFKAYRYIQKTKLL